jgi:hypothetical protein
MEDKTKHRGGRPPKEIDVQELTRLLDAGVSVRQIRVRLGCGYGTVHRAVKALRDGTLDPKLSSVIQNPTT